MSFGFTNASAFQQEMNDIFQEQHATVIVVFLDDIIIYSHHLQ